jgi:hypothetical protein
MSQNPNTATAVVGIDIGKNSFHVVGLDRRGAIVLRQKWWRGHGQVHTLGLLERRRKTFMALDRDQLIFRKLSESITKSHFLSSVHLCG